MENNNGNEQSQAPEYNWRPVTCWAEAFITLLFVAVAMWLLAVDSANYLRKIELLSYFAPTGTYLSGCLQSPGGLLVYASTFLTQTFYYPWLGASVYTALLLALAFVSIRALRMSAGLRPLSLVLPSVTLLALLSVGYGIFSLKSPGYAFNLPLGLTVAMTSLWLYRSLHNVWLRLLLMLVIVAGGYCVMGFYGLLAGAMCAAFELTLAITDDATAVRRVFSVVTALIGAAAIWGAPQLWMARLGVRMPDLSSYTFTLPPFSPGEIDRWIPYCIIIGVAIVMAALSAFAPKKPDGAAHGEPIQIDDIPEGNTQGRRLGYLTGAAVVAAGTMACAVILPMRDANLRLTLDLDHALQECDWQQAIVCAQAAHDIRPTRINVVLTDMALLRAGGLGDHMFRFPIASSPTLAPQGTEDIIPRMIVYHTGMVSNACSWATKYQNEGVHNVERLQYIAKTALLNGDKASAREALDELRQTAFHHTWADHYYKYVDHPRLMADDPEMGSIMRLRSIYGETVMDSVPTERNIWGHLAYNDNGSPESLELSLNSAMICQDLMVFAGKLPRYVRTAKRLPVHIQEAILVWQALDDNFDISLYPIDSGVRERFEEYKRASQMYADFDPDHQEQMLKPRFGDTFWFYYIYRDKRSIF